MVTKWRFRLLTPILSRVHLLTSGCEHWAHVWVLYLSNILKAVKSVCEGRILCVCVLSIVGRETFLWPELSYELLLMACGWCHFMNLFHQLKFSFHLAIIILCILFFSTVIKCEEEHIPGTKIAEPKSEYYYKDRVEYICSGKKGSFIQTCGPEGRWTGSKDCKGKKLEYITLPFLPFGKYSSSYIPLS